MVNVTRLVTQLPRHIIKQTILWNLKTDDSLAINSLKLLSSGVGGDDDDERLIASRQGIRLASNVGRVKRLPAPTQYHGVTSSCFRAPTTFVSYLVCKDIERRRY